MTPPNDQKSLNLASSAFSFYGQHTCLCPVTLVQLGAAWRGDILIWEPGGAYVTHFPPKSGSTAGALTEFKAKARTAQSLLFGYNESGRKAAEGTIHKTELG